MEPTRAAGLARVGDFVERAGREYAETRNFDFGPDDRRNVSGLSPYLRHRLLTETELLAAVLNHHSVDAAGKFVDEIFWRAYFKGWLEHRPTVWTAYRRDLTLLLDRLQSDAGLRDRYETAIASQTGIDCFDAWVSELVHTGYLHNHARMWFASIWVFTLGLPWQLGADFLYRHLLDGDPASNTLSWRWVCGLHTRGKTYLARASNIARYTDNRFDPGERLARRAPPLGEESGHAVQALPPIRTASPNGDFGLLLTEEDCSPESLGLAHAPRSIVGAVATEARSPLPVGSAARAFAAGSVADGLARAGDAYGVPAELAQAEPGAWGAMLAEWASRNDLETIVTARAPVGPVAELLAASRDVLRNLGVRLLQVGRNYDAVAWPHATRGFFKLKSAIPAVLRELKLTEHDSSS